MLSDEANSQTISWTCLAARNNKVELRDFFLCDENESTHFLTLPNFCQRGCKQNSKHGADMENLQNRHWWHEVKCGYWLRVGADTLENLLKSETIHEWRLMICTHCWQSRIPNGQIMSRRPTNDRVSWKYVTQVKQKDILTRLPKTFLLQSMYKLAGAKQFPILTNFRISSKYSEKGWPFWKPQL